MFKLVKWIIIITIVIGLWYLSGFYLNMNDQDRCQIKKYTIEAIESGDTSDLKYSIFNKIKDDLQQKKWKFFEYIKPQLKRAVHWLMGD